MNKKFRKEWQDHFGKVDLTHRSESKVLNQSMHQHSKLILAKIDELESTPWILHDAQDKVNVYSDYCKIDNHPTQTKKVPHNSSELERFQLYEQMRSFSKQLDIVRRASFLSRTKWMACIVIACLLLTNDFTSLVEFTDDSQGIIVKAACSALIMFCTILLVCKLKSTD